MLLLPYGFTVDPDIPDVLDWRGWLAWVAILGIAALLWKHYRHGWWFAAGLLLLLPSSSIFPAADLAADRRLYLPMVAFAALAGLLLKGVRRRMLLVPLALGLAAISFTRTKVWLTEHALWSEAVERAPGKLRPLLQLSRASEPESALRILDYAQTVAPNDSRPAVEKGLRLLAMSRPDQALAQFERALALLPNDPEVLNNRGVALTFLGRRESAAEDFRHALSVNPCMTVARRNLERLGITYPISCR
jgi:tetratricopeptide (TPR) repeat protein